MFTVRIAPAEQLGGIDVLDRVEDIRFDLRVVCREGRDQLLDFRAFGVAFQLFLPDSRTAERSDRNIPPSQ